MRDRHVHARRRRQGEVSRLHRLRPQQRPPRASQPSFTIISNHCAHLGCPVQPNGPLAEKDTKTVSRDVTLIPTPPSGFGCPCHGGQYDTEGNRTAGPPVRALDRYSFSIRNGHLVPRQAVLGLARRRHRRDGAEIHKWTLRRSRASTSTGSSPGSTRSSRPLMARRDHDHAAEQIEQDPLSGRLARGALRARRRRSATSSSGTSRATSTGSRRSASATLTAFIVQAMTGVILAMYYKPDPDKAYASIQHITNDLCAGWLVRGMHRWGASVLHHPDVPAHGARLPVRRLQVPARAELDHRRPAARAGPARGLHRLPAAVGPDRVLGDDVVGININGTAPFLGPVPRAVPAGRRRRSTPTRCRASTRSTCCCSRARSSR